MAALLKATWKGYFFLFDELADTRTKSWPLASNPIYGLAILWLYFMIVLKWGPKFMQNRQPFNLDRILIVYNSMQMVACAYVLYEGLKYGWGKQYKWFCEPVNRSNDESGLGMARFVYHYYMLKYVDLLDTIFFVLRKKYNQVSVLHLFHHSQMVVLVWGGITYFPGGHGSFIGVINSFVHVIMYGYYLLTIVKPDIKASLWWKKYITQLQIIQLFLICLHFFILIMKSECDYPKWPGYCLLPGNVYLLILFLDFYYEAYLMSPVKKVSDKNGNIENKDAKEKNL